MDTRESIPGVLNLGLGQSGRQQFPDFDAVCVRQTFEGGYSQLLFHPCLYGLIILVGDAGLLGKLLLSDAVKFPQLFEPVNEVFLCFTHINSFALYACSSHPTIGRFFSMRKISQLKIVAFGGILAITGCVSSAPQTGCTPKQTWYQAWVSAEQTTRDLAECQYQAMLNEKSTSVAGDTLGQTLLLSEIVQSNQRNRQNQMIQACMTAKGYTLVSTNDARLSSSHPTNETLH